MSEEITPIPYRKETWGDGPWQNEPDREDFISSGFSCFVQRNQLGAWCGYVGVPETHSSFGKKYSDLEVDVHGGPTFSGKCGGHICHAPKPGMPEKVWWIGFDCGHGGDLIPSLADLLGELKAKMRFRFNDVYRDINYVKKETRGLAKQLKAAK